MVVEVGGLEVEVAIFVSSLAKLCAKKLCVLKPSHCGAMPYFGNRENKNSKLVMFLVIFRIGNWQKSQFFEQVMFTLNHPVYVSNNDSYKNISL